MKKTKKEPEIMIADLHCHILPGVDDGAKDYREALELVRTARLDGTQLMFLTPHFRATYKPTPQELKEKFQEFYTAVRDDGVRMKFMLGSEVRHQSEFTRLVARNALTPMAKSRYMLLEFPTTVFRPNVVAGIRECLDAGFVPIIAHAERYDIFRLDPTLTDEVLALGARIQLNADSVMGKWGFSVKRFCHRLIKADKAQFIASDAHDLKNRPPKLKDCYLRVRKKYGDDMARKLFWQNPRAVMENRPIDVKLPTPSEE